MQAQGFLGNGMQIRREGREDSLSPRCPGGLRGRTPGVQGRSDFWVQVLLLYKSCLSSAGLIIIIFYVSVSSFIICHPVLFALIKSWQVKLEKSIF